MRVAVDRTKCQGIGLCEMTAPSTFELGDDGVSRVLVEDVPDGEHANVLEAVQNCPTGALVLLE